MESSHPFCKKERRSKLEQNTPRSSNVIAL